MTLLRYEFTNFTDSSFTGRYGGIDYTFAPGETRMFDPDKHYMLLLLAKQLADRELGKKVKSIGRDPKDMETWGKSLGDDGKIFVITSDMRRTLMREAVGNLVDIPIPIPADANLPEEAGSTKETNEDVKALKDQVAELTATVQALTKTTKAQSQSEGVASLTPETTQVVEPQSQPSMTRSALTSMAQDLGINNTETMTKEELIHAISSRNAQI
jgi:hypothetical protein